MRLHTTLSEGQIYIALDNVRQNAKVDNSITFVVPFDRRASRTHQHSYEIQLGTYDKNSLPSGYVDQHGHKLTVRRYKNSGQYGATSYEAIWAATWHEWGWFIAEIYRLDPKARFGPKKWNAYVGYTTVSDFHVKTGSVFENAYSSPE